MKIYRVLFLIASVIIFEGDAAKKKPVPECTTYAKVNKKTEYQCGGNDDYRDYVSVSVQLISCSISGVCHAARARSRSDGGEIAVPQAEHLPLSAQHEARVQDRLPGLQPSIRTSGEPTNGLRTNYT